MDRFMPMKTKAATYSIPTIRKMLGLGKTESYWLIEHRKFETVVLRGHVRVTKASFEEWYENQIKYKKVDGTPPGKKLREKTYIFLICLCFPKSKIIYFWKPSSQSAISIILIPSY